MTAIAPTPRGLRAALNRPVAAPFVFVAALLIVQAGLLATGHVLAGAICDAALVLMLANAGLAPGVGALAAPERLAVRGALQALAVVALIPVLAVGLPLRDGSADAALLVIAPLSAALAIAVGRLGSVEVAELLVLRAPRLQLWALGLGLGLGLVAYLVGAPRLFVAGAPASRVLVALVAALAVAAAEELVFRGLVLGALGRLAPRAGLAAASMLFAASYFGSGSVSLMLVIAIAGVGFGGVAQRSRSLSGAIAGHAMLALGAGAVWPLLLGRPAHGLSHSVVLGVLAAGALAVLSLRVLRTPPRPAQAPASSPRALVSACAQRLAIAELIAPERSRRRELCTAVIVACAGGPVPSPWPAAAELAEALGWLATRRGAIERTLVARHLPAGGSPRYHLHQVAWLEHGYGVLTDSAERPLALNLHASGRADPKALAATIAGLQGRLAIHEPIVVCDPAADQAAAAAGPTSDGELLAALGTAREAGVPGELVVGELVVGELVAGLLTAYLVWHLPRH